MGLRDGQRASIDVSFLFGDDYRVIDFTDIELLGYFRIWAAAVKYRCHLLPHKLSHLHTSSLAVALKIHRKCVNNMLRKCGENALLQFRPDGRILVVGVGVHHSWLVFKDGPNGENWQSKNGKFWEQEEGSRKKDEGSKDQKKPVPPSAAPLETQRKAEEPKPKDRSLAQKSNDEDVREVQAEWDRRYPDGPALIESLAQKILVRCQAEWIDPRWFLRHKLNAQAKDPIAYLSMLLALKDFPRPPDDEHAAWKFDAWARRPKLTGLKTAGEILSANIAIAVERLRV